MLHRKLEHALNTNIAGLPQACAASRDVIKDNPMTVVEHPIRNSRDA
jgi:hypothetical protein